MVKFATSFLAVFTLVAVGFAGFVVTLETAETACPPHLCPTGNSYAVVDQSSPDLFTASKPTFTGSSPDILLENELASHLEPAIVLKKTIPGIDQNMVAILSSMVSHGSEHNTGEKMDSKKNFDLEEKMTGLMSSIMFPETSSLVMRDLLDTSMLLEQQEMNQDIKQKMLHILGYIRGRQEHDQAIKLKMVKLLSTIVSEETHEAVKWKMLKLLLKIASQETETEIKSKMIAILQAIDKENNTGKKLKAASILSAIVDYHTTDETRSQMENLLSTIVAPVENFEAITKTDTESTITSVNRDFGDQLDITRSSEAQLNTKLKFSEILTNIIHEVDTQELTFDQILELTNVLFNISREDGTPTADTSEKEDMVNILSNILHDFKALEFDVDQKSEMIEVLIDVTREEKTSDADPVKKTNVPNIFSKALHGLTALELGVDQKSEMINILLKVAREPIIVLQKPIPGIDENMLAILSSMVSRGSEHNTEEKTESSKNMDLEGKMTSLMSSLVSLETSSREKWDLMSTLSKLLSEQGMDTDINPKMFQILENIMDRNEHDHAVKLKMAKLMSAIVSENTDEAVKWKMLKLLLKIASQETETEIKSKMIAILQAISEENSIEKKVKTANSLSALVDFHAIDETRSQIESLLSMVVSPVEKEDLLNIFSTILHDVKALELGVEQKSEMINVLSSIALEENTADAGAAMKTAMTNVDMLNVLSEILHDLKAMKLDVKQKSEMIHLLSSVAREEYTPDEGPSIKRAMMNVFSKILHDLNALELDVDQKSEMINVLSSVSREENTPDAGTAIKTAMTNVDMLNELSEILHDLKAVKLDVEQKSEMIHLLSSIAREEYKPDAGPSMKVFSKMLMILTHRK
ncbi:hypothetical protein GHT06_011602 [Daphnia sinensis]|uniref:Uncharacterized protein n=1 Tax=Daphnia sinensis TaxID=1820382 RepID=A0AAD5KU66_9CRUS|nr:hypothetical protein GHT06_011602 [Daphnia sinensis]